MKKRAVLLFVVFLLLISSTVQSYAEFRFINITPSLEFNGNVANCSVSIIRVGKTIDATLSLWHGGTCVASWHKTKLSSVVISETATVVSGVTYTLTVSGTIDGVPFSSTAITKTCP